MALLSILKQPGETLRQPMTFGGVLTISALVSVVAVSRALVPGSAAIGAAGELFANAMTLVLSGGTDGERYLVTVTVDDADGERRQEEVEVACIDLGWAMPDGGAPMLSIAEFVERFGIDEVVRMTDARGDGRIGKSVLVGALTDAQALVEAHVSARYALPVDPVPTILKMAIADLARARLYPGTAPEGVVSLSKAAIRMLERIQSGAMPVAGASIASETASETRVLFHSAGRIYPDNLAGF